MPTSPGIVSLPIIGRQGDDDAHRIRVGAVAAAPTRLAGWKPQPALPRSTAQGWGAAMTALPSERMEGEGLARPAAHLIRIDPAAPLDVARTFLVHQYRAGDDRTLHHHRGGFYTWNGAAYVEIAADDLRAKVYDFLDKCRTNVSAGDKIKPNKALVTSVFDALTASAHVESTNSPPTWLNDSLGCAPNEIVACKNGLLHLPSRKLLPHTPMFFTHNSVEFPYDKDASKPQEWVICRNGKISLSG